MLKLTALRDRPGHQESIVHQIVKRIFPAGRLHEKFVDK